MKEKGEEIEEEDNIEGIEDGGVEGGGEDFIIIIWKKESGEDKMKDEGMRRKKGKLKNWGRDGEIKEKVRIGEEWKRIVGNRKEKSEDEGKLERIIEEKRGKGKIDWKKKFGELDRMDGEDESLENEEEREKKKKENLDVEELKLKDNMEYNVWSDY